MLERSTTSPNLTDRGRIPALLRVLTELVGWITLPWGLAHYSWAWSVLAVVILIVVPGIFATPGDKDQITVPVHGTVTIAFMLLELMRRTVGRDPHPPHLGSRRRHRPRRDHRHRRTPTLALATHRPSPTPLNIPYPHS